MKRIVVAAMSILITSMIVFASGDGESASAGNAAKYQALRVANGLDDSLSIVDGETYEIIRSIKTGVNPHILSASPDGGILYVVNAGAHDRDLDGSTIYIALSKEDSVAVVDAISGKVQEQILVGKVPEQIDLSQDGKWLFASNNGDSTVSFIDTDALKVVTTIPVGRGAYGLQAVPIKPEMDRSALISLSKNTYGYALITPEQLKEELESKEFTLINVHIPYGGEIVQTDANIPFNQIADSFDQLPDKDQPIVLYCRSGGMSRSASRTLVDLGFTNVVELKGGFNAWRRAGYDLIETN